MATTIQARSSVNRWDAKSQLTAGNGPSSEYEPVFYRTRVGPLGFGQHWAMQSIVKMPLPLEGRTHGKAHAGLGSSPLPFWCGLVEKAVANNDPPCSLSSSGFLEREREREREGERERERERERPTLYFAAWEELPHARHSTATISRSLHVWSQISPQPKPP